MVKGWFKDNWKHSLAAKGIKTRRSLAPRASSGTNSAIYKIFSTGLQDARDKADDRYGLPKTKLNVRAAELGPMSASEEREAKKLVLRAGTVGFREQRQILVRDLVRLTKPAHKYGETDEEYAHRWTLAFNRAVLRGGTQVNPSDRIALYRIIGTPKEPKVDSNRPLTIGEYAEHTIKEESGVPTGSLRLATAEEVKSIQERKRSPKQTVTFYQMQGEGGFGVEGRDVDVEYKGAQE